MARHRRRQFTGATSASGIVGHELGRRPEAPDAVLGDFADGLLRASPTRLCCLGGSPSPHGIVPRRCPDDFTPEITSTTLGHDLRPGDIGSTLGGTTASTISSAVAPKLAADHPVLGRLTMQPVLSAGDEGRVLVGSASAPGSAAQRGIVCRSSPARSLPEGSSA